MAIYNSVFNYITRTSYAACSEKLQKELEDARQEYEQSDHFFIPEDIKEKTITRDAIVHAIRAGQSASQRPERPQLVDDVYGNAKNLFSILAYMKKGSEIRDFMDEGISDEDLPFERLRTGGKDMFSMRRKEGRKIETLERWNPKDREELSRVQWYMLSPVFHSRQHYKLHDNVVRPFVALNPEEREQHHPTGGGYSNVFITRIHSAHHKFHSIWPSTELELKVAIKELLSPKRADFDKEKGILLDIGNDGHSHPNLVKLLASFEQNRKFYLIFPCANSNLREYWNNRQGPISDKETILWALKQMKGIAEALDKIHNFAVTMPLGVEGGVRIPQDGVKLSVKRGEEKFGRHGDIKPENILWFEHAPGSDSDGQAGILQIADFGLGRFHGRDSRTEPWPHNVVGSPTYEPPECELHCPVSRAYDLWGLGCLYLEFATWILMGNEAIGQFSTCRDRQSSLYPQLTDDHFFTIIRDEFNGQQKAVVREGVTKWVCDLHAHESCSQFLHDLLKLIMDSLLQPDAAHRIESKDLCSKFESFLVKAAEDNYLCASNP
ncbi:uncharacterized protein K452DRAFT_313947 [Aplosporella prunicola CBS 121167]|uniref:Protein kinase domain-containing protein n=1 Tax=Aplosporella prunicola CBS 121167 TaxID=1176127 RepID=A0A6A6AXI1_9PEZI|nr:uncharacterized protein K452DRAFT_313947 [Aplosporella prunicola CBS 121167]KAF2135487.1 hypothetical protein K452DRAFT_313947 [Aplosporella prunicola CBS 121167]